MSYELQEAFSFLFTGRGLFIAAFLVVAGFFIGGSCRVVGVSLWSIAALVTGFYLFTSGSYFQTLDLISRTGSGGFSAGTLALLILGMLLALYCLAIWLGIASRRVAEEQAADDAAAMSADEFVRIINAAAAHPILGQGGWLATRWATMETAERRKWVSTNIDALRALESRTGGAGIECYGTDLPSMLAMMEEDEPGTR